MTSLCSQLSDSDVSPTSSSSHTSSEVSLSSLMISSKWGLLDEFADCLDIEEEFIVTLFDSSGTVTCISKGVETILGWRVDDIIGSNSYAIPETRTRYFRQRKDNSSQHIETIICRKGKAGGTFLVERPVEHLTTQPFEWIGDVFSVLADGTIATWDTELEQLTEYSKSEAIGKNYAEVFDEGKCNIMTLVLEKALSGESSTCNKVDIRTKTGVNKHLAVDVCRTMPTVITEKEESVCGVFVVRDITADEIKRKQFEDIQYFAESGGLGLHWIGTDGVVIWANASDIGTLGYDHTQIIGSSIADFHTDVSVISTILEKIQKNENFQQFPARLRHKDGSVRHVLIDSSVYLNDRGQYIHTRCFTRDVTEQRLLEEECQRAEKDRCDAIIREQKAIDESRIKSEFLATMSHEIRTPINGVVGMTSLLLETELTEQQREFVEGIESSSDTLLSLINDILDLTKIELGKIQLEDIPFDLVKDVVEKTHLLVVYNANKKNLPLHLHIDPSLQNTRNLYKGDPNRLKQVVLNFLSNAVKFTEHGSVTLSVSMSPLEADTTMHMIHLEVVDSGVGIEDTSVLFNPFTQASASVSRQYGGSGLGLSISRQLVEVMGGTVGIESTVGVGSKVWANIPLKHFAVLDIRPPTPKKRLSRLDASSSMTYARIMVAEDNVVNRKVVTHMLSRLGYKNVVVVENGKDALDLFNSPGQTFDLILMDCLMPIMDGIEASQCIRMTERKNGIESEDEIPIVALTASASDRDKTICINAGMNDFCTKPITLERLNDVVMKWL